VRVLVHLERVLAVGDERVALLRHDGREEDLVRMQAHSAASASLAAPARPRTSGQCGLRDDERARPHERRDLELGRRDDEDLLEIAEGLDQELLVLGHDDERRARAEAGQHLGRLLRRG
jgi:hypothetical protein